MMKRIYFDNASTTPLLPEVIDVMSDVMKNHFGNPSSIHFHGRNAKAIIEECRKKVAGLLKASIGEIYFTSCATEANNMVLKGAVEDLNVSRIISVNTEHHCVLHTLEYLKSKKVEVILLSVDANGFISLDELEILLKEEKKTLASVMYANNEVGTIQEIEKISALCKEHNTYFHCDAVQAIGKFPIDVSKTYFSFLSASAHKFHGPKGIGFLYMNGDNIIKPMIYGGAQERNMRAGTENIICIAGMTKALEMAYEEIEDRKQKILDLRSYFMESLSQEFEDIVFNGSQSYPYLYTVLSVSFPPSDKVALLMFNLDIAGISASSGSACSSGVESDSHVLQAIGHPTERKTIRFSFSHLNTKEEVDTVIEKLKTMTPVMAN